MASHRNRRDFSLRQWASHRCHHEHQVATLIHKCTDDPGKKCQHAHSPLGIGHPDDQLLGQGGPASGSG